MKFDGQSRGFDSLLSHIPFYGPRKAICNTKRDAKRDLLVSIAPVVLGCSLVHWSRFPLAKLIPERGDSASAIP
jgi:hypothetical protein